MEINEDNLGYTLRETYVETEESGERVEKSYFARVDPTFDAGDTAKFIVSHEDGGKYPRSTAVSFLGFGRGCPRLLLKPIYKTNFFKLVLVSMLLVPMGIN